MKDALVAVEEVGVFCNNYASHLILFDIFAHGICSPDQAGICVYNKDNQWRNYLRKQEKRHGSLFQPC